MVVLAGGAVSYERGTSLQPEHQRCTARFIVERVRGGPDLIVFKAHRLLFHSTLGLRVIKKGQTSDAQNSPAPNDSTSGVSYLAYCPPPASLGRTGDEPDGLPRLTPPGRAPTPAGDPSAAL